MAKIARNISSRYSSESEYDEPEIKAQNEEESIPVPQKDKSMTNPFIGDSFFKENPTKILGEQVIEKGRFGSDIIKVKGTMADLEKIDAIPVAVADFFPTSVAVDESKQSVLDTFVENELQKQTKKKFKEIKKRVSRSSVTQQQIADENSNQEVYSCREVGEIYNKNISREELEAYYFTNPIMNHKLLFDEYTFRKDELIEKGLICYDGGKWVYYYSYISGNVNKKISDLKKDKERIVDFIGEIQYERQMAMLMAVKPKAMGFVGDNKIILLPHSNFAKEIKIRELRGKPELNRECSLFDAFKVWLRYIPNDRFTKSNYKEVIDYYLDNKGLPISKDVSKAERQKQEKNAINIRQRTKEEGDALFADFLAEELLPEDQAKVSLLWNEKFNSIVEPDLTKIPVCFQISKTFKSGAPLRLNPTQRQGVAFQTEKHSGLFAYGVGVGKSLTAICSFEQGRCSGLAKRGIFVVPTNTYDKWMGDIQGYVDKESGKFMHGAMPHLPEVVGLFNLNPDIVREKLKVYSKSDEALLLRIMNVIEILKSTKGDISEKKFNELSAIYPVNFTGLKAEYESYVSIKESSGGSIKSFSEYVVQFLRDEYNYNIYSLGSIRKFPEGQIFVTTEVGLQRLGVNEMNKSEITSRLFKILSQGEMSADDNKSERDIAGLQLRIEQMVSSTMKNAKINIEDLGLDWACFDEAHYYKKLFTYVKGAIINKEDAEKGDDKYKREKSKYELKSGAYPSARALSAFLLSHYIQANNDNRNVIQLTATPFTNSPLEVFSMLTLTNYHQLEEMGLDNMVDFFDTFMKINYDIKYTPQKTVVKDIVLTGYNNLPQLRSIIYSLMDKKDEGANLIRPDKHILPSIEKGIETTIPMTGEQEELMAIVKSYIQGQGDYAAICQSALQEEVDSLDFDGVDDETLISEWERNTEREYSGERENLSDKKREDLIKQIKSTRSKGVELDEEDLDEEEGLGVRILRGLSMMRQITLSPYLYRKACGKATNSEIEMPHYLDYVRSSPKFKYVIGCVDSVIKYHKERNEKISGQVIYMNAGIEYFPLLKEYLVKELGLLESQVGIVSGKMSKGAKETVKRQFLNGDILVLIGSSTISVGVDLQNNSTVLYNCYYDWNPTDAAQIEGRIWRQGNRFANVRIVYPQCYNSADPIIFEYLNQKTLRINEIWNRSSDKMELDLRDFNPKELQKKLITDPEEKADWEMLEEVDKIESQIIYFENRSQMLIDAMNAARSVKSTKASIVELLTELSQKRSDAAKKKAVEAYNKKISEIVEKFSNDENPAKMQDEIMKYKKSRYDHVNDPDGKYQAEDYSTKDDFIIYTDAAKYRDIVDKLTWADADEYGDIAYNRYDIVRDLNSFRSNYKDMKAAEDKVLKPMGLTFETALNPVTDFNNKLTELREQLASIHNSKEERVARIAAEMAMHTSEIKTVEQRIAEFAADNPKYLSSYLIMPTFEDKVEGVREAGNLTAQSPIEELMNIDQSLPQVDEVRVPESKMATHEIVAPSTNLIVYGKSPDSKTFKAMDMNASDGPRQVSNLVYASLIKPDSLQKAKDMVDSIHAQDPTWDWQIRETGSGKKWYVVKGDPNYVAPEETTETVVEETPQQEVPAVIDIPQIEEVVAVEEPTVIEPVAITEEVNAKLEQKEEVVDELSRDVIESEIKALTLAFKYASGKDAKEIKEQISTLKQTLKYI